MQLIDRLEIKDYCVAFHSANPTSTNFDLVPLESLATARKSRISVFCQTPQDREYFIKEFYQLKDGTSMGINSSEVYHLKNVRSVLRNT